MKRHSIVGAFLFLLVMVISACTPAQTAETPDPGASVEETQVPVAPAEKRTLVVQGEVPSYPGEEDVWGELAAAFEEEYNVEVVYRFQGGWQEIGQNLEAARIAQENVDITSSTATLLGPTLAPSGILMDLTDLIAPFQDRFVDGMLDAYTFGDRVWSIPLGSASTSMIFYNATMFEELGIDEPQSFADLVSAVQTIEEAKGIDGMIHQGKHPWYWPMWYFETFAQTSGNNSFELLGDFLAGNRNFCSPEEIAAFESFTMFADEGVLRPNVLDIDNEAMTAAFAQEKTAMFYGGLWELSPIQDIVDFEIGIFEFPLIVDTPGVVPLHGGGPDDAWAIPSFAPPENIDIQVQWLEFITREENAAKLLATYDPYIPVVKGVEPFSDPLAPELNTEFAPHTIRYLDWIWPVEVNDVMTVVIPAVMFGNMTPQEACQQVQNAYETIVEEKQYSYNWWDSWTEADWAKVEPSAIPSIEVKN